jgi:hypothetical protein
VGVEVEVEEVIKVKGGEGYEGGSRVEVEVKGGEGYEGGRGY